MSVNRLFFALLSTFLVYCAPPQVEETYRVAEGETMGTYYRISYRGDGAWKPHFDSILIAINEELSTYIPASAISSFNRMTAADSLVISYPENGERGARHFYRNMEAAQRIFEVSNGAFNPCVMPLVNYWGFGYSEKRPVTSVDSSRVDSLLALIDFAGVSWKMRGNDFILRKSIDHAELDLSAIAKGYAVDFLAEWIESRGCRHYLVDIGGEARTRGVNARGVPWTTGINTPKEDAGLRDIVAVLELDSAAVATSGNYRNFYEVDGRKYSHTISPFTGYPERSDLLSVSVIAGDCMTADALATACMVKGLDGARAMIEGLDGVEAYFIFSGETGNLQSVQSDGFSKYLKKE